MFFGACYLVLLVAPALAEEKYFKDVPKGHWANDAVYDLVRRGVTGGYPDGTFRGDKNITRYELASFLEKLSDSTSRDRAQNEKLAAELKSEIALEKYRREQAAADKLSGSLSADWLFTSRPEASGAAHYRLKTSFGRDFGRDANLRINLDSMDAGFDSTIDRPLATAWFDAAGEIKSGAWLWGWTFGPGKVLHQAADGAFPSEQNYYFNRPSPSVALSTSAGRFNFSGAYTAHSLASSGLIGLSDLTARFSYDLGQLAASFQPRYYFNAAGGHDLLGDLGVVFRPNTILETELLCSIGSSSQGLSGLYGRISQKIGPGFKLRVDAAGNNYRIDNFNKTEVSSLNNFDRLITDGTIDLGLNFNRQLAAGWELEAMADYVTDTRLNYGAAYPGTYFEWQAGAKVSLAQNLTGQAYYRQYNVPSGIAQFSSPAPVFSDLFGLSVNVDF